MAIRGIKLKILNLSLPASTTKELNNITSKIVFLFSFENI